jgi:hypothetical protein
MRLVRLIVLALLPFAVPASASGPDADIVVRGDVSRSEIERILAADNVDTSRLSEREVADAVAEVARGRAPQDFWAAYQAHVRAWERLADAAEKPRREEGESRFEAEELVKAEQAIEATFDEVERIARSYGARLPAPAWAILPTV